MPDLRLEQNGEVAELIIDRPAKRNAMSYEMWTALPGLCAEVDADATVKVLVVRGAGPHFCAGADISEFGERRATPEAAQDYGERVEGAARALAAMRKPSIAMIRGYCIGGGCELAVACDLRFAETASEFAITPAKLGIVYGFASTRQLVSLVGPSFARYLLYSAERVDASHALRVGLVDEVVASGELEARVDAFVATICSRSQVAVQGSKRLIGKIVGGLDVADDEAHALAMDAVERDDYREGVDAFLAKRSPRFGIV